MANRKYACDFYSVWAYGTALYVKWATQHGISYTELSILYALMVNDVTTQKEICEYYGLPKQTVNNCILQFERDNYIQLEASKHDKRKKNVILTEAGKDYAQNTLSSLFEIEEYICRNISSDKFVQAIETRELFNMLFEKRMKEFNQEENL